jgi:hypothetical protein
MRHLKRKFAWNPARWLRVGVCVALASFAGVCLGQAQSHVQGVSDSRGSEPSFRLLTAEEGRAIIEIVSDQNGPAPDAQDCSHLVHRVYLSAGFAYPYASSYELYAGNENFQRVRNPQPGDLVAWPGHVGIVLNPREHSFYSLVSTGLEAQDYAGNYWRSRGRPRFYRYKVENTGIQTASTISAPSRVSKSPKEQGAGGVIEEREAAQAANSDRPPKAASERKMVVYGPPAPQAAASATKTFEIPPSIVIAAVNKQPTKDEVAQGISEISNASGNVLRTDDPSKLMLPVVIFEQFHVERLEIKRDHGWAHLQIDSRATIAGGETDYKRRHEKVRWELRRTDSGWKAITPADRTYVPSDVAVRNLAAQLARLTEGDGAAVNRETVLMQEAELANLLSGLLEKR